MDGQQWWGDVPTWISSLAIVFAAGSFFLDRRRRAHEREREEKSQATGLSSWVVTDALTRPRVYGVIIANDSGSTFHSVEIVVTLHKQSQQPITLVTLPPGRLFVPLDGEGAGGRFSWGYAMLESEYPGSLRPYTVSDGYVVESMAFSDNLTQRWHTDRRAVLTRASDAASTA